MTVWFSPSAMKRCNISEILESAEIARGNSKIFPAKVFVQLVSFPFHSWPNFMAETNGGDPTSPLNPPLGAWWQTSAFTPHLKQLLLAKFEAHVLTLPETNSKSSPLKIGPPWKFGDSEPWKTTTFTGANMWVSGRVNDGKRVKLVVAVLKKSHIFREWFSPTRWAAGSSYKWVEISSISRGPISPQWNHNHLIGQFMEGVSPIYNWQGLVLQVMFRLRMSISKNVKNSPRVLKGKDHFPLPPFF